MAAVHKLCCITITTMDHWSKGTEIAHNIRDSGFDEKQDRYIYLNNVAKLCHLLLIVFQMLTNLYQISIFMSKITHLCQHGSDPHVILSHILCENYLDKPK